MRAADSVSLDMGLGAERCLPGHRPGLGALLASISGALVLTIVWAPTAVAVEGTGNEWRVTQVLYLFIAAS